MCLFCTVSDIFSVKYCRDLEMCFKGRSRSLKITPIDRSRICLRLSLLVCYCSLSIAPLSQEPSGKMVSNKNIVFFTIEPNERLQCGANTA